MNQEIKNKINELHNGKVVRIINAGWFYKIVAMDSMASIVMYPVIKQNEIHLIEEIVFTSYCSLTQAELFIKHILL